MASRMTASTTARDSLPEVYRYCMTPMIVDAADHGMPQHRERLFIVAVCANHPLMIDLAKRGDVAASSFSDFGAGKWQPIEKPGRATNTLGRIAAGRRVHGVRFISSYYGAEQGGRSIHRQVGTITTRARHAIIDGDRMRVFGAGMPGRWISLPTTSCRPRARMRFTCLAMPWRRWPRAT